VQSLGSLEVADQPEDIESDDDDDLLLHWAESVDSCKVDI
jgi:hypothetical protein